MPQRLCVASLRPLVRYVDEEQAVIDAHFSLAAPMEPWRRGKALPLRASLHVAIDGGDGFHDEADAQLVLEEDGGGGGGFRFEVVHPDRWWPSGMGDQPLYDLTLWVGLEDGQVATRSVGLGLTSVRPAGSASGGSDAGGLEALLVNGRPAGIRSVLPVDVIDQNALLPASGSTLLLVRDHYGDDLLYDAADRAGVLLIQCVPIDAAGAPEASLGAEVERLGPHPSLAGWYVGHLGGLSDAVAAEVRRLDPVHTVFRTLC